MGMSPAAFWLAFSPTACPPIPSATTKICPSVRQRSSLFARMTACASWLWLRRMPTSLREEYSMGLNPITATTHGRGQFLLPSCYGAALPTPPTLPHEIWVVGQFECSHHAEREGYIQSRTDPLPK